MLLVHINSLSSCLGTIESDLFVFHKGVKGTNGIGSTTNTGNHGIRKLAVVFGRKLFLDFLSNNTLKVTDDGREGVRSDSGTNQIVSVTNVGDPITHRFVDGVLESFLTSFHRNNLGTKCVHSEDIQLLSFAVNSSHVDNTFQSQHGTDSRGCDTVLPSTCFGNDARLAKTLGQKSLSNSVVDFVSTSVRQIFSFEPNISPSR
mmetsp:Transcript_14152/g.24610  ORF Transcript_14152/g.24610 Transcript_14152/m.24610 type:complete len:203 (-) Transcript_14152:1222-1830(-)